MSVFIRFPISESFVKIQQFRHEWSTKMYEEPKKTQ